MGIKERNELFIRKLGLWEKTHDKKNWDDMFLMVLDCCSNTVKKRLNGLSVSDDEMDFMITGAACSVMDKIRVGKLTYDKMLTSSLAAWCHFPVIYEMYNKPRKFYDRILSLDALEEKDEQSN